MLDNPLPAPPTLDDLFSGMRARVPWRLAAPLLARRGAPRARGWDLFLEKVKQEKPSIDVGGVADALIDHILHGEKASRFFQVDPERIGAIRTRFGSKQALKSFPFSAFSESVDEAGSSYPTLCFYREQEEGIALVYQSVRAIEKRRPIDPLELPESARAVFGRYKELIGVQQQNYRAYDVIWIPSDSNVMELRADFPPGTNVESAEYAITQAIGAFEADIGAPSTTNPIDLFPIIKRMYDQEDEGKVVELALHTSTGSFKHEKMRLNDVCLRVELYHSGGKGALSGAIELFKLAVQWDVEGENETFTTPELFLNGSYRMLQGRGPGLETAIIRNCVGAKDYQFVRAKIDHYLKPDAI